MATADARDILGITNDGPRVPAPKPKKKGHKEHGPRLKGMQREARALQGDSVPPVTLTEAPRYKERPNLPRLPARHWEQRPFVHGARSDNLILKHWKRANPGFAPRYVPQTAGEDTEMEDATHPAPQNEYEFSEDNYFAKYDVRPPIPKYTEEQYEEKLKDPDWTKEETDYLMETCHEFGLRWILIADRYEPSDILTAKENINPANTDAMVVDSTALVQKHQYRHRKMEELKSRYYQIAAKMLETQIPASNMTQTEFQLWEKMRNFDAKSESVRKDLAEKLFERTKDEAEEERVLLEELKRITTNEEEFLKMRRDLYSRLEPPPTRRSNGEEQSTAMYQTSSGLSLLLQNLLAKEKRMKRPTVMPNGDRTPTSAADAGSQKWEKGRHPNQYSRRDTLDSNDGAATGPQKKLSQSQPNTRTLTPAEELKFGVSYPQERLTSGVAFRHEKATKVLQAKSSVQAQKISNALTELGIPTRLGMPTERVCREFERLVQAIHLLLDTRKGVEKVGMEVKVLEEAKRVRLGLPKEGKEGEEQQATNGDKMQVEGEQAEPQAATAPEDGVDKDESQIEAVDDTQNEDGVENEGESKIEQEEENEDTNLEREDDEGNDEGEENASNAEVDDSDAEQAQNSRKRRHEESSQVSEAEDEDEDEEEEDTGLGQEEEDDENSNADVDVDETQMDDDADSNADLGSQNDVSDEEEQSNDEDDNAEEDEVEQPEEDEEAAEEEAEDEAEAEIEESELEPAPSTRPGSSQSIVSRLKRSASVVSEGSRAGSNRSGVGRKKRR